MNEMKQEIAILEKQEMMLQFDRFNQSDALALGNLMVQRAVRTGVVIAVSIRLANGCILFQYLPDGTNALNENWIRRKFQTVITMSGSSLRETLILQEKGRTLADQGLDLKDYALCGGGFPIRIKGSDIVIGAVIASNLYHIADHEFVVGSLKEYLNCPDAPDFPYTLP